MKGTGSRPPWPAPTAKTVTAPAKTATTDFDALTEPRIDPSNQITLAVLDEAVVARVRGYDPYNKSVSARPPDVWQRKRKRD